ncbi:hypothetical protein LOZ16_005474 [Ophidiomyces ophidiicola]|nr:hypothetical protein LOZ16_005474 [Ophidiomyces ophidiicola]
MGIDSPTTHAASPKEEIGASRRFSTLQSSRSTSDPQAPALLAAATSANEREEGGSITGQDQDDCNSDRVSLLAKHSDDGSFSEMEYTASEDNFDDDEEAGLTTQQRKKRGLLRRKRRDEADAKDISLSLAQKHLADKNVVRKLAVNVVFILLWYFFSVSISLYNNWMFDPSHLNFSYPLFTTSVHMIVQFTLASTLLYSFPQLRPRNPAAPQAVPSMAGGVANASPILTKAFYFTRLVPCGTATSLDIGLGNMSLKFISLTFLTMCKSSTLGFVLLFALILGLETASIRLIMIICAMTIGVVMMVADEATFNAIGFSLIIASSFFSGFRWALTQFMLLRHPATSNPFSTLFFLTPIMFVSLITLAFLIEGPFHIWNGLGALVEHFGLLPALGVLLFPGTLAFCMIASEFALLRRSSVVTLSICGIFKEVITIAAAGILYDDRLTLINVAGLVVTTCCIGTYNYMKITSMRKEAQKDVVEHPNEAEADSEDDDETSRQAVGDLHNSVRMASGTRDHSPYGSHHPGAESNYPGSSSGIQRG